MSAFPPVLDFPACPRLSRLSSNFSPVLDFLACSQLSCLSSTFSPVLDFLACSWLSHLSSTFLPVLDFLACPQFTRMSLTFSPFLDFLACPRLSRLYTTPPSIQTLVTWVPQNKLTFGQTPHIGWPSGLWPSPMTILQSAASLAPGGYDWPAGPIENLFW